MTAIIEDLESSYVCAVFQSRERLLKIANDANRNGEKFAKVTLPGCTSYTLCYSTHTRLAQAISEKYNCVLGSFKAPTDKGVFIVSYH